MRPRPAIYNHRFRESTRGVGESPRAFEISGEEKMKTTFRVLVVAALLAVSGSALAVGPITFGEAEFPQTTVVDGLAVTTLNGAALPGTLTFGYTLNGSASNTFTVSGGPGTIAFVQDPSLQGFTGGQQPVLTIDFGVDVPSVSFGYALATGGIVNPGAVVQAFDSSNALVTTYTSTAYPAAGTFAEGYVYLIANTPFRRIVVTPSAAAFAWAFDNLSYPAALAPSLEPSVPTLPPAGLAALGLALVAAGFLLVRRMA